MICILSILGSKSSELGLPIASPSNFEVSTFNQLGIIAFLPDSDLIISCNLDFLDFSVVQ